MIDVGILFDYNGVLVDDEALHERAFAQVLRDHGVVMTSATYARTCLGKTDATGFEQLARDFEPQLSGIPLADLCERKTACYRELARHTNPLFPGVVDLVRELSRTCRLGIVTSSHGAEVHDVLDSRSLTTFFAFVIASEHIVRGKPHPDGYIEGLVRLKLPRDRVVVIEDSPSGVAAAKSAGLRCIAVLHTVNREQLAEADLISERVSDIDVGLVHRALGLKLD